MTKEEAERQIARGEAWKKMVRYKASIPGSGYRSGGLFCLIDARGDVVFLGDDATKAAANLAERAAHLKSQDPESLTGSERVIARKLPNELKLEDVGGIPMLRVWHERYNDFLEALTAHGLHFYTMPWVQDPNEKKMADGDL